MAFTEFDGELDDDVPGYVEFNEELDKPKEEGGFIASAKPVLALKARRSSCRRLHPRHRARQRS